MITGTHAIIYAHDPERARAFFRDVLDLPGVDAGGGWLIFRLPPAELGIHPADSEQTGGAAHELFLICDDIDRTMAELSAKGAEFTGPVAERRFGLIVTLRVPGAGEVGLYQPRHPTAYDM